MGVTVAAWLAGLAALAIPLAIHLWSRRRTTPVVVGSIRWLEGLPPIRRRTLRLRQPWRLLLRLAMLASLVLALAGAYLRGATTSPAPLRWLVVSPELAGHPRVDQLVDSLGPMADDARFLHPAWPPLGGTVPMPAEHADLWTLLFALDQELPPGSRIDLVAAPTTANLRGSRPTLATDVVLHDVATDSLGSSRRPVLPGSAVVYAGEGREDDGRYLAAGLRALAGHADSSWRVTLRAAPAPLGDDLAPWIAWLSADSVPQEILSHVAAGATLLTDADHSVETSAVVLPTGSAPLDHLRLYRRGSAPEGVVLWRDDSGEALLTVARMGEGWHYRLVTRFHPAWTDLVLDGAFPRLLLPLVDPASDEVPIARVAGSQAQPNHAPDGATAPRMEPEGRSLFWPLWVLAALLFLTDVALSLRPQRVPS